MSEHQTVQTGKEASAVLENEAYKQAMKVLRDQVIQQWKECPVRDREGQLLLLQLAKITDKFEGILRGMIESAKFAQHQIDLNDERNESKARKLVRKVYG